LQVVAQTGLGLDESRKERSLQKLIEQRQILSWRRVQKFARFEQGRNRR
jgi:hypothetical protein